MTNQLWVVTSLMLEGENLESKLGEDMFYRDLADVASQLNGEDLDIDGILQAFCMRKFADRRFFASFFLGIEQDGRLRVRGFFGAKPEEIGVEDDASISIFDDHPAAESIRRDSMVCAEGSRATKGKDRHTVIAWPVESNARILGSLVAISDSRCEDSGESRECLEALILLVNTTLARKLENGRTKQLNRPIKTPVGHDSLTERQEVILKLISEGRTNGDIAEILGYSESLIRQETIRIYAILKCNGRQEAAQIYLSRFALNSSSLDI